MHSVSISGATAGQFPEIPKSPVRRRIEASGVSTALALALADLFPTTGREDVEMLAAVTGARCAECRS